MALDRETQKILSEGEELKRLTKSDGWILARQRLIAKLATLDSIRSVPKVKSAEEMLREYSIREGVVSVILEWLSEVEGAANSADFNTAALNEARRDQIIIEVPPAS